MADLELVEGEAGDVYNITVEDKDGNVVDLTALGITTITLFIAQEDKFSTPTKTITGLTITGANNEIAAWAIVAANIPTEGHYFAQLLLTDGASLTRKTRPLMTVHVEAQIGP